MDLLSQFEAYLVAKLTAHLCRFVNTLRFIGFAEDITRTLIYQLSNQFGVNKIKLKDMDNLWNWWSLPNNLLSN